MQHELVLLEPARFLPLETGQEAGSGAKAEFGVIDAIVILVKHWRLMTAVVLLSVIIGGLAFYNMTQTYEFSTVIEIGTNGSGGLLESAEVSAAKLRDAYIPQGMQQATMRAAEQGLSPPPPLKVAANPNTPGILVLSSRAPASDRARQQRMHKQVISLLQKDHSRTLQVERDKLERQLLSARDKIEQAKAAVKDISLRIGQLDQQHADKLRNLEAATQFLLMRRKRLADSSGLLNDEIRTISAHIKGAEARRSAADKEVSNETRAMAMLMIDNELRQTRTRLSDLQQRLRVKLPQEQDSISRDLVDKSVEKQKLMRDYETSRQQLVQQQSATNRQVEEAKAAEHGLSVQLANFRETQPITLAFQSQRPVGISRAAIWVLCIVLGLIFAVLCALGAEVATAVRLRLSTARMPAHAADARAAE